MPDDEEIAFLPPAHTPSWRIGTVADAFLIVALVASLLALPILAVMIAAETPDSLVVYGVPQMWLMWTVPVVTVFLAGLFRDPDGPVVFAPVGRLFSWFPTTFPTVLFVGLCGAFGLLLTVGFTGVIGAGLTGPDAPLWETFMWGFIAVSGLFAGLGVLVTAVVVGYRYTRWANAE